MREVRGSYEGRGRKIAIVVSLFNELISKQLLQGCLETLIKCGVTEKDIGIFWVPGAFEMPVVVKKISLSKNYEAVICLGAIIRGDTPHFEYIASQVSRGLSQISLDTGLPVIFGLVTADTQEQALERAGIKEGNRGREAGLSCLETVNLLSQF